MFSYQAQWPWKIASGRKFIKSIYILYRNISGEIKLDLNIELEGHGLKIIARMKSLALLYFFLYHLVILKSLIISMLYSFLDC